MTARTSTRKTPPKRGRYRGPEARKTDAVIGANIEDVRIRAGFSAPELADRIGVARATLRNWERGASECRPDRLAEVATALKVSVKRLRKGVAA